MAASPQSLASIVGMPLTERQPVSDAAAMKIPKRKTAVDAELDRFILRILGVIILLLSVLLISSLRTQWAYYDKGMTVALTAPNIDHSAALTYARASDAAGIKLTTTFLGFLLIFTGALYVLRHAKTEYQANASHGSFTANLQTSSPGLVVVTLGVVLVGLAILTRPEVGYYYSSTPNDSTASGDGSAEPAPAVIQPGHAEPLPAQPAQSLQ